MYKPKIKRKLD
jgi:hypothetical protein